MVLAKISYVHIKIVAYSFLYIISCQTYKLLLECSADIKKI